MSRDIDLENLNTDDARYLRDRPWMREELRRQGHGELMDLVESDAVVRESPEELSKTHTDQMRVGTQVPQQIDSRPNGVVDPDADEEIDDNYEEWSVEEIKSEIKARNNERSEDTQIALSGNKAELVARLHKADEDEMADASA